MVGYSRGASAHRLAGHLQEGEQQQQDDGDKVQQLRSRMLRRLRLLLPRAAPEPGRHAPKMRAEHSTPAPHQLLDPLRQW
jgi:hypothetical protein